MTEIYPYFIKFHIVFSIIFLLIAVTVSVSSFYGWIKRKEYKTYDKILRHIFISFLYTDLFLGIILYFFLKKPNEMITAQQAMKYSSLRFWAVQHFSNMIFVVIFSQIGSIFIKRTAYSAKKFKYSFIYFGVSTLIILISVGLFALRK